MKNPRFGAGFFIYADIVSWRIDLRSIATALKSAKKPVAPMDCFSAMGFFCEFSNENKSH